MVSLYLDYILVSCIILIEFLSVVGPHEIITFSYHKERRDEAFIHVVYWIQLVHIKLCLTEHRLPHELLH